MEPDRLRTVVAEAIRALCRARGLTQEGLADLAGVSHSYMERVVTCRSSPTTDWIAKVAEALGVQPMALLDPQYLDAALENPQKKRKFKRPDT